MTDIFNDDKPKDDGTPAVKPGEGVSGTDAYLGLILNEQGEQKYSTAEEALKGSVHAQSHITKLESELKELREKAEKDNGYEQILEALQNKNTGDDKPLVNNPGVTPEDITKQVEELLTKRDVATTTQGNITTVVNTFNKLYGEKASETMYAKAKDIGLSENEINSMIATNPTAALKVLGIGKEKIVVSDPVTGNGGHAVDLSDGKPTEKPASIMGATNSKQLTDSWKLVQAETNKRLGVEILP